VVRWECSPRHLADLAVGWLVGEGRLERTERVRAVQLDPDRRTIRIDGPLLALRAAIEPIPVRATADVAAEFATPEVLRPLYEEMFARAELKDKTGGVHTGALVVAGEVRAVREDVSRHCVVDKLIGAAWHENLPPQSCRLLLTSRVSGAIAAKVARAGVPIVTTMSVPTTLAGAIAGQAGVTMVGRARSSNPHVYRGEG
jgi:FdhD protein